MVCRVVQHTHTPHSSLPTLRRLASRFKTSMFCPIAQSHTQPCAQPLSRRSNSNAHLIQLQTSSRKHAAGKTLFNSETVTAKMKLNSHFCHSCYKRDHFIGYQSAFTTEQKFPLVKGKLEPARGASESSLEQASGRQGQQGEPNQERAKVAKIPFPQKAGKRPSPAGSPKSLWDSPFYKA